MAGEKGEFEHRNKHTQREDDVKMDDWSGASTKPRRQRLPANQKLGRVKEGSHRKS